MNKLARQKAHEILGKYCPMGLEHDGVIDAITEALEQFPPSIQGKSSTNSPLGSVHWFNTLMGKQLRMGEFLKEKNPGEEIVKKWGKELFDDSKEIIDWFESLGVKQKYNSPYECKYFDEAQGKHYCTNPEINSRVCIGGWCLSHKQK